MIYFLVTAISGILLFLLPLPFVGGWWSPNWMIVTLVLFNRYHPKNPLFCAFVFGLAIDLLSDGLLGIHALCCVLCAHFMTRYQQELSSRSLAQEAGVIAVATGIYQLVWLWFLGLTHQNPGTLLHWVPVLITPVVGVLIYRAVVSQLPRRFGSSQSLL